MPPLAFSLHSLSAFSALSAFSLGFSLPFTAFHGVSNKKLFSTAMGLIALGGGALVARRAEDYRYQRCLSHAFPLPLTL